MLCNIMQSGNPEVISGTGSHFYQVMCVSTDYFHYIIIVNVGKVTFVVGLCSQQDEAQVTVLTNAKFSI